MQFIQFTAARADTGQVLPYATCTVFLTGTMTPAALYDASGGSITNPVTANNTGLVGFAAANGTYDAQITSADGLYTAPSMLKVQIFDLQAVANALAAAIVAGIIVKVKDTKANLAADLAATAGQLALVYADTTTANNDIYVKLGASGSGSWQGPLDMLGATRAAASAASASASATLVGSFLRTDTPPGWLEVFTDQNGRIPGGITDQGVLQFDAMQALNALFFGLDGSYVAPSSGGVIQGVRDQSGNFVWYVGEDGIMHAGAAKIGLLNGSPPEQLQLLSQPTPPRPIIPAQLIAAPSDGQSLAIGINTASSGVGAVITSTTRFGSAGALMLHGGVRSWDPTEDDASLIAAIETIGAAAAGAGSAGETPLSGYAEFLNELLWKENGLRPADHGMQSVIFAPGLGSTTIAQHQSGQSLYTRHHTEAQAIKSLANGLGKSCKKLFTSWMQGESETSPTGYAAALLTLRNSDAADTKTEFGQTDELYYFCYQNGAPDIALQHYLATKLSSYIKIANPIYWMAKSDGTHLTAVSSKWHGAYIALVFKRLFIDGRKWNSVRPLRDVDGNIVAVRSGSQVTLYFDVPSGGQLVLDTTGPTLGEARQKGHYLFASDGVTEQTVTNVDIVGRNAVRLTCASAVPASCIWRYGYTNPASHVSGAVNGNMRDNQGDWLVFDGLNAGFNKPMHNWCVAFEESIA